MNDEAKKTASATEDVEVTQADEGAHAAEKPVSQSADGLAEIQVWRDFAAQYGRQTLTALIIVAVVAGGFRFYRHRSRVQAEEARGELFKASTLSERQSWVERYPKSDAAPIGQLRLAAAQYSAGSYGRAKEVYQEFLRQHPTHEFAPMAEMGLAHSLDAAGMTEECLKAFEAFMASHPKHFLYVEAVVGKSRCLLQLGRAEEARTACEDYIAANAGTPGTQRVQEWLKRVNRAIRRGPAAAASAATPLNLDAASQSVSTNVIDLTAKPPTP
jgi:TolA-binding protein